MRFKEFFLIDLRSLAIFRIGIALCIIVDLISRFRYIDFFQTSNGFLPEQTSLGVFAYLPHYWNDSYVFQVSLWGIAFVFAIMLLIGCYTRLATFASWGMLVSLHSLLGISIDGADAFLRALLLWSIFLPLGANWSIDSGKSEKNITTYFSLAGVGLILVFVFYYFSAGIAKLNDVWLTGAALEVVLRQELWLRPAGEILSQYPAFLKILTLAVLAFELVAPFILLIPQRFYKVRIGVVLTFVLFQLGLGVCIELNMMPWIATTALIIFIPFNIWGNFVTKENEIYLDKERFKNFIVIPLIIYVFGGFFFLNSNLNLPFYNHTYPLGLISTWNFYDYPPEEDYDYYITVKLDNGETLTILESIYSESIWKESTMNNLWQNYRFKNYLESTTYQKSRHGKYLLNWIVKKWELEHPTSKIISAQFNCSTKNILVENGEGYEIVIAEIN